MSAGYRGAAVGRGCLDGRVSVLHELPWPRRTERLLLRPPVLADAAAVLAYRSLPEVHRWLGRSVLTMEEAEAVVADPERAASLLVVEHDGVVVGDLMLMVTDAWSQEQVRERAAGRLGVLGWAFDPAYAGRGLATEAAAALLPVAFDELGVHRVVAECFLLNEPSWRLMERLGMRREAHAVQDSLHAELGWLDGLTYALLASEWRALTAP